MWFWVLCEQTKRKIWPFILSYQINVSKELNMLIKWSEYARHFNWFFINFNLSHETVNLSKSHVHLFWTIFNWYNLVVQLNKYETAPKFIQSIQNLTLLIKLIKTKQFYEQLHARTGKNREIQLNQLVITENEMRNQNFLVPIFNRFRAAKTMHSIYWLLLLNKFETAPKFIQSIQNLTSDCLLS